MLGDIQENATEPGGILRVDKTMLASYLRITPMKSSKILYQVHMDARLPQSVQNKSHRPGCAQETALAMHISRLCDMLHEKTFVTPLYMPMTSL